MVLRRLRRGLFWLSRTRPMGVIVRVAFGRLWWLLPVRRVAQTKGVLAFEHPAPSWQPHVLLVPKRAIRSLLAARQADGPLVGEIVRLARAIAMRRRLDQHGFALMVNGGAYQDVPQLHFHLAGLDNGLTYSAPQQIETPALLRTTSLAAYRHPQPQRAVHLVALPTEPLAWMELAGPRGEAIGWELLLLAQGLIPQLQLGEAGFTLLASVPPAATRAMADVGTASAGLGLRGPVSFHLVSGDRLPAPSSPHAL